MVGFDWRHFKRGCGVADLQVSLADASCCVFCCPLFKCISTRGTPPCCCSMLWVAAFVCACHNYTAGVLPMPARDVRRMECLVGMPKAILQEKQQHRGQIRSIQMLRNCSVHAGMVDLCSAASPTVTLFGGCCSPSVGVIMKPAAHAPPMRSSPLGVARAFGGPPSGEVTFFLFAFSG